MLLAVGVAAQTAVVSCAGHVAMSAVTLAALRVLVYLV